MKVKVNSIGGIKNADVEFDEGVTVVQGSNFQGKSSVIEPLGCVIGAHTVSDRSYPLSETADEGSVMLECQNDYLVELERDGEQIVQSGELKLEDEQEQMLAHLFAVLGERNPIRQAIESADTESFTDLIQQPIQMDDIDEKIAANKQRRERIKDEIKRLDGTEEDITKLETKLIEIDEELDELHAKRQELEEQLAEIDSVDDDLNVELENKRDALSTKESERERRKNELAAAQKKLENKTRRLDELEIPDPPQPDMDLSELRDRQEELDVQSSVLDDLYRANNTALEEGLESVVSDVQRSLMGDEMSCWVCGQQTERDAVEERVNQLNAKRKELQKEKVTVQSKIDDIEKQQKKRQQMLDLQDRIESDIGDAETTIEQTESQIRQLEKDIDELETEIEELEQKRVEVSDNDELSDELSTVEQQIGAKEREKKTLANKRERIQSEIETRKERETELQAIEKSLQKLRTKRRDIQDAFADSFSKILDEIISMLQTGFDGGRIDPLRDEDGNLTEYRMVLARDDHETQLDNLSESERTLVGLAVCLAGYEAFEVGDVLPIILIDSVSELTTLNLRSLIELIDTEINPKYLITTVFPAFNPRDDTDTVTPKDWQSQLTA